MRERAREVIARTLADMYPMGEDHPPSAQDNLQADTTLAALEAAGIALVDANELITMRGYKVIAENALVKLKTADDERRRLLAFRDAFNRLVFSVGWGADERQRFRALQDHRAAVADIESEGDHANSLRSAYLRAIQRSTGFEE